MKNLEKLEKIGQSLWYDNIQRSMLQNGAISEMINRGEIKGMTSNPSIFQNAIAKSTDYDIQLQTLAWSGTGTEEIFWKLAIDDVQTAADLFRTVYEKTQKLDGYVSIEVNPNLAHDTEGTVKEAINLWTRVNRPNLMVKVPATTAGIPAIRKLISLGININITLIFSIARYKEVVEAYISGLEDRVAEGKAIDHVASVASFFVSRVDSKIDAMLAKEDQDNSVGTSLSGELEGKAGIFNTQLAYKQFLEEFGKQRFQKLLALGGKYQRPLWASTSTKNPKYRDVMYVEELIAKHTVNTVPPVTLSAFVDHGVAVETISKNLNQAVEHFIKLEKLGISIDEVTNTLETEGVQAFIDAFKGLLLVINERRKQEVSRLGMLFPKVQARLAILEKEDYVKRLFDHDPNLWTESPEGQKEILQRMDWLEAPWNTKEVTDQITGLLDELIEDGITNALILGMGGSSLAPEVFSTIQLQGGNRSSKNVSVSILDSTHPDSVAQAAEQNPVTKTIFIVSSKSGTTGEINAFFNFFFDKARKEIGDKAGSHFIVITDPGTKLEKVAQEKNFRRIITANPRVGGRNSALTAFGLAPANLCGVDTRKMIDQMLFSAKWFSPDQVIGGNPGVVLGSILGEAAINGLDKLTILADDEWNSFAAWMEQLVAESSGKNGKGILPIAEEPQDLPAKYQKDRLFVYLRKNGQLDSWVESLVDLGHCVIVLKVKSALDLAYQFYLWEVTTATACSIIGVNSFDQPDVQDAKTRTLSGIEAYKKTGQFITAAPKVKNDEFLVYSTQDLLLPENIKTIEIIKKFVAENQMKKGYLAINAFIPRDEINIKLLNNLRGIIQEQYGIATTLGFGPRYLHSTGQLHKGGPDNGLFVIITNTPKIDFSIPGEGITFGKFCFAQALGDESALLAHGRKVLRIHFLDSEISLF